MPKRATARVDLGSTFQDSERWRMTIFTDVLNIPYDHAQEMTEYLESVDPRDYREWSRWFRLMVACKCAGVDRQAFIDWSTRDPDYAADEKIGKTWDSLRR
jgi:hypothetical protein